MKRIFIPPLRIGFDVIGYAMICMDVTYNMIVVIAVPVTLTKCSSHYVDFLGCLHLELTDDLGYDHLTA